MNKLKVMMQTLQGRKTGSAQAAKERLKALQQTDNPKPELKKAA